MDSIATIGINAIKNKEGWSAASRSGQGCATWCGIAQGAKLAGGLLANSNNQLLLVSVRLQAWQVTLCQAAAGGIKDSPQRIA